MIYIIAFLLLILVLAIPEARALLGISVGCLLVAAFWLAVIAIVGFVLLMIFSA